MGHRPFRASRELLQGKWLVVLVVRPGAEDTPVGVSIATALMLASRQINAHSLLRSAWSSSRSSVPVKNATIASRPETNKSTL